MADDLLETAHRQAEKADPSVRAAALLRIARAQSAADALQARQTLLEGLDAVQTLPASQRDHLFQEARGAAAAVSPELLAEIPVSQHGAPGHFSPSGIESIHIVQAMLSHGHLNAAFDYLLCENNPDSFPFFSVGAVLHQLDPNNPENATRRLMLLRHTVELWRKSISGGPHRERNHFMGHHHGFVGLFGHFWNEFPPEEALSIVRTIVDRAVKEPDAGASASYQNEIYFSSPRQDTLFQIFHVLRHLDSAAAESLLGPQDQLAIAVRRYPNGIETMNDEAKAETERRKAERAACKVGTCESGGYILTGDPRDFDRQRQIIDAVRNGDFAPAFEDALEKYRQDTSPDAPNYAPKEYWPSTGAFRSTLYQAGKRLGSDASRLLDQIPDDDLRLFASIELAAALSGAPASTITSMKHPHPLGSHTGDARIISASCSTGMRLGPAMRSPDGRLIRCPKCRFQPSQDVRWACKCGHVWNTFWTKGNCPECHFQWEVTGCPQCGEMSEHRAWYSSET
jgi:hypothetical protein